MRKNRPTFTKNKVDFLLAAGVIGAFIPYVLAFLGKETVEAIGLAWITEIVAVILGYYIKSYKETKQEEIQKLENRKEKLAEFEAGMERGDE